MMRPAGAKAAMARAFHSPFSSSPRSRASSPLPSPAWMSPSPLGGGGGIAGLHWLLGKRGNRVRQHGHGRRTPLAAQMGVGGVGPNGAGVVEENDEDDDAASYFVSTPYYCSTPSVAGAPSPARERREALARLRSAVLSVLARPRRGGRGGAGSSRAVTGTIFGRLRGRVHLALQTDPRAAAPAVVLELAAYSTGAFVREMASGLVRLALECEKASANTGEKRRAALLEETTWRAYCNGRKCGYAVRRECGAEEWRVLRAVEPVSVGAGVLPDGGGAGGEGDMMYMRARFERVVGSKDSEAFYMVSPDGNGGPELSIYLLRV